MAIRHTLLTLCALATLSCLTAAAAPAQDDPPAVSATEVFEQTLATEGLATAIERLEMMFADTTDTYEIDGRELAIVLPTKLTVAGNPQAALGLLKALEDPFGDHPRYWKELGKAYLWVEDLPQAETAYRKSLEIAPDQPDVPWLLANLTPLAENVRVQMAAQNKYLPGESTGLQGPYLGQVPPGSSPEVFAPGLLSTLEHEYSISFAPDGREIYFSRGELGTLVCRWHDSGWTFPEPIVLMDAEHLTEEASISPDGQRIFFCARPLDLQGLREIHVASRQGDGWGQPRHLFTGMYPTATLDGTLYYTEITGRPDYGVIVSRAWADTGYSQPDTVAGVGINTDAPDAHPFISPDEKLLLFDSMREQQAGLFVSSKDENGRWQEAIHLGDLLGIPPAGQAALSPDGRYLFFCLAGDMYWVDAGVLYEKATAPKDQ